MPIQIVRNDITKIECDVIVNAANSTLLGGRGVDGAIHRAAGKKLLLECIKLGGCRVGQAKLTNAYKLPAKYIIHTVGPKWKGGKKGEQEFLESCYRESLKLAVDNNCESIAFPLISCGIYGYPIEMALKVAVGTISSFLINHDLLVYIVIFDEHAYRISEELFKGVQPQISDDSSRNIEENYNNSKKEYNMSKEELIFCFQDTCEKAYNDRLKQRTMEAIKSNRVYKEGFVSREKRHNKNATIDVYSGTTFDVAKRYCSLGKVAVLNFANPVNPGGGVQFGAMAQEECLCRSSNLYACISNPNVFDEYYGYHRNIQSHFYTDRLIYTKDVTVFKDDSLVPQMLPETDWFNVDVITCAAPYLGEGKSIDAIFLVNLFKSRIKNIFEAARDNNVDYLILGAFGCGAFGNPPLIVSEAFLQTIKEENYFEDFKQIVFAIKPTGKNCHNLSTFSQQFACFTVPDANRFSNNKFSSWQLNNRYFGKRFSILGDSISTLQGFNPEGYNVFYQNDNCIKAGVAEAQDTWWGKVISFFGGELLVNNSWSGSCVTKLKNKERLFPSGCSDERTGALHINNVKPDVIIVYLGTNDWANGSPTWEYWKNSGQYEIGLGTIMLPNEECFDIAYEKMLSKLKTNYPNAEIWCCTLCETYISKYPEFQFPHKCAGTHIDEYNEIIRKIAGLHNCKLVDLYNYRIAYDSIDGSHPTNIGMNTIATMIIRSIAGHEVEQFLDCEDGQHGYKGELSVFERQLYSDILRLTITSSGKTVQFQKNVIEVGRNKMCDLLLEDKPTVARRQATFLYEKDTWFLRDNFSTNGTWLNGTKIQPGKKYQLVVNDEIDFAMAESVIFYKQGEAIRTGYDDASSCDGSGSY